ncbi:type II toxin-antitoxin system VapC family toxin [Halovivax limisalsi]|uniref:type II toxin-antitoxin system VapC family toxin n=1 Tax=Halovivax limisalsi TaxID=1453760 RepID=UPI001FFCD550|nr:PIN domain-containing protein [Halovivax limisalsi]
MAVAMLDTNVLFASASARDAYHDRARELVRGIDYGELPDAIVTDYVVAEALNLVREKLGPEVANGVLERLIEGTHFEVVHTPQTDFIRAQSLFREHPQLSFVDATLAAYMHREDVQYLYSFDDDFDVVDELVRLDTATNPHR